MDALAIETLRVLSVEQIDKAKSGHPGIALGAAPIVHTLYTRIMNINPGDDIWINRDRFVLAAGHGSALLYAALHLAGFGVMITDLKRFRQYESITPGHPEYGLTPGVDSTSGPLGQGIPVAVGMAIAEEYLRARFNKPDYNIFDHYTFVLCGDGDLQEGVTQEAFSLAGHLALSRLIVLYDSNDIQLDGAVNFANSENVAAKYQAMGWDYIYVEKGDEPDAIEKAVFTAKRSDKPVLIEIKTVIGRGSEAANTHKAHGSPLPSAEVLAMRRALGGEAFSVAGEVYDFYRESIQNRGLRYYRQWDRTFQNYKKEYPGEYALLKGIITNSIDIEATKFINIDKEKAAATRVYGGKIMDAIGKIHQGIIGGSADLSSSTKISGADGDFCPNNRVGRNIRFGVREHAMGAICNGLALHYLRPVCSTFFVFSDYLKPALRMSALMRLPVIYVFTHDSIAVGEDGPTHQPVEQLTMLRSIPNVITIRPADAYETVRAWDFALKIKKAPVVLVLSRQSLPNVSDEDKAEQLEKGAYICLPETGGIDGILMAGGSELHMAAEAKRILYEKGFDVRVVSIPSTTLFDRQPQSYKDYILPPEVKTRVAVEMSEGSHLYRYIGTKGVLINMNEFGASAPGARMIEVRGFTPRKIVEAFLRLK